MRKRVVKRLICLCGYDVWLTSYLVFAHLPGFAGRGVGQGQLAGGAAAGDLRTAGPAARARAGAALRAALPAAHRVSALLAVVPTSRARQVQLRSNSSDIKFILKKFLNLGFLVRVLFGL